MNSAKIVGSCFAFSAVAAMEGITMISTGKLISLAGQELLDCDTRENCGCWGAIEGSSPQPVSVSIAAEGYPFQFYSSGVFTGFCGTNLVLAVTVVGYGTSNHGTKYWLVKNSRGTTWGENGYIEWRGILISREVFVALPLVSIPAP
ncbi:hypothetical protein POTOM_015193 [Populus tomentosa]|uniref:Peptidase C1A papain C-terminal domain-containing protein n=1 Tax=Populus tomentosa TaxID=118781 RepID=A0A8X8A1F8_POPTO|nr:hypothetical protein POTOM_015193 [Populus tomentosa]